jgi:hypothetical protein
VLSVQNTDLWAKAGVMIRDTLDPASKFAMVIMAPGNGCRFQLRRITGGAHESDTLVTTLAAVRAPHWVKLERTGDVFKAYNSLDPATDGWHELVWGGQTITMQSTVYIGLCVTSHNINATCVGEFSDVSTTGNVTGAGWTAQAIGSVMASNTPDQLYVAIQDTGGKVKAAIHADPAATILNTWQEWSIPLKTFTDGGVNLKGVKKLYLGAGNRASPALGGAGSLYFDDIRLYPAQCLPAIGKPAADITGDCAVDYKDLDVMAEQWLKTAPPVLSADLNTDSKVDLKDFAKLAQGWLEELLWP